MASSSEETKKLVTILTPIELQVLKVFQHLKKGCLSAEDILQASQKLKLGLEPLEQNVLMRAAQWLANKNLITEERKETETFQLTKNGQDYLKNGLPERRLLQWISSHEDGVPMKTMMQQAPVTPEEYKFAFGFLKKNGLLFIERGTARVSKKGQQFLEEKFETEVILSQFTSATASMNTTDLEKIPESKKILKELQRRGIIERKSRKHFTFCLTQMGQEVLDVLPERIDYINVLTPEIIKQGTWKTKPIRPFDIHAAVPPRIPGRRHFYNLVTDYIRRIWIELGFEEMRGNFVETEFWNFDCLYVPQDHPAREMQDTFYMKNPKTGDLPEWAKNRIGKTHEKGTSNNWLSWGGKWSTDMARQLVLRTHTTVLSARTLVYLKENGKIPGKYFSVGRVFRNEAIDWSHLAEFDQVEGIVVDPDVTFSHLLGYLKIFFAKLGYPEARFRPAYFPYTEPSVEIEVYHPVKKKWVELGGAGIFRPEVTEPLLGEDIPVLAWGPGLSRMVFIDFDLKDIRTLYANDLGLLRNIRLWQR